MAESRSQKRRLEEQKEASKTPEVTQPDYWIEENYIPDRDYDEISPSGRYLLHITHYQTKPGAWSYTKGTVYALPLHDASEPIAEVKRNYMNFHHGWVEGVRGHDYLLTGEHYMGQTVIELDTGKRADRQPKGEEFCFAEYTLLDDDRIEILGCYWACPYERVIFDFSEPLGLPWPELSRREAFETNEEDLEQEWRNG